MYAGGRQGDPPDRFRRLLSGGLRGLQPHFLLPERRLIARPLYGERRGTGRRLYCAGRGASLYGVVRGWYDMLELADVRRAPVIFIADEGQSWQEAAQSWADAYWNALTRVPEDNVYHCGFVRAKAYSFLSDDDNEQMRRLGKLREGEYGFYMNGYFVPTHAEELTARYDEHDMQPVEAGDGLPAGTLHHVLPLQAHRGGRRLVRRDPRQRLMVEKRGKEHHAPKTVLRAFAARVPHLGRKSCALRTLRGGFSAGAFGSCAWRRRFPRSSVGTIRSSAARSAGSIRFCRTTRPSISRWPRRRSTAFSYARARRFRSGTSSGGPASRTATAPAWSSPTRRPAKPSAVGASLAT